ncbi:MAG: histidinol-phosphate transaminase, partial [Planctomycetes bacterium]|nr:histidinol-phosphate transaminase [Planctomycetota bacterium]
DVVKLNTNENPYPPSPKVTEAIESLSAEGLRRYPQPLADGFRQAAAEVLGVRPENIICTNGGDDLLTICFRAFCDCGRPAAWPVPTYSLYEVLANLQDCQVIEADFADENWRDKLVAAGAALTIVCNPNAPTGRQIAANDLAELAEGLSGVLLIDEAYVDFAGDNCIQLVEQFDNVIILRSMSKGYSLAGLRFGFGVASEGLIAGLMKVKDSYNVDAVSIAAATAAIMDQDYFKANVEKVVAERARMTEELTGLGFQVGPSETNFLLAQISRAGAIYEKLAEGDIYVRYWNTGQMADKLRVTIGTREQNDALLKALKQIMQ